jgi:hypothetical protein
LVALPLVVGESMKIRPVPPVQPVGLATVKFSFGVPEMLVKLRFDPTGRDGNASAAGVMNDRLRAVEAIKDAL